MAGLTSQGFDKLAVDQIIERLEARVLEAFPAANVKVGVMATLIGAFASELAEAWEASEGSYLSAYPDTAVGAALERLCALTGTTKRGAQPSTVTLTVNLDAGTTLPVGSVAHVAGDPTRRFATTAEVENTGGSAANFEVAAESEETGPVSAPGGTITVIATPVSGWNTVTNDDDADLGSDIESDAALRVRRVDELSNLGACTVDSIRSDLLVLFGAGVLEVAVFENVTSATDGDGVPPHAIEVLVRKAASGAPTDQAIADAIFSVKPAGILAHGDTTLQVEDSRGVEHSVSFSEPAEQTVYLEIDVTVDADEYPADGDDLISAAVAASADARLNVGDDVILSAFYAAIFGVAGVLDVTEIRAGFAPSPAGTANLAIASRDLAVVSAANVLVTAS